MEYLEVENKIDWKGINGLLASVGVSITFNEGMAMSRPLPPHVQREPIHSGLLDRALDPSSVPIHTGRSGAPSETAMTMGVEIGGGQP
jgi:hypothetical protein